MSEAEVFPVTFRCPSGKRTYTKKGAKRALAHMLARGRDSKPHQGIRPYHCGFCGCWHLGHPNPVWRSRGAT